VEVQAGERMDDLQYRGLRIIQDTGDFCFGLDSVLLADFASARPGDNICDLGTGNGILPLLISGRVMNTRFDALEIDPAMAARAERNVRLNGLENRVSVYNRDLSAIRLLLPSGGHDLVVCNPPYFRHAPRQAGTESAIDLSRTDAACTMDDVSRAAKWLLRNGGKLAVVFPATRMLDAMDAMRAVRIEPKRFRLVSPYAGKAPFICLIEGVMGAKPMLHPLPPLVIHEAGGGYTAELRKIYHMESPALPVTSVNEKG
jgi:tRNA1Val (adenine37-N6)-methyltransferase